MAESTGADPDYHWGPGDVFSQDHNECEVQGDLCHHGTYPNEFRNLLQRMESKIDAAFSDFGAKLQNLESRVTSLEQNPHPGPSTPSSSSSGDSSVDGKRKHRTPPELQVSSYDYYVFNRGRA